MWSHWAYPSGNKLTVAMIAENCTLSTSTGALSCVLSRPSRNYLDLVVICCHGSGSDKNTDTFLRLEKDLGEKIALFRFDFYAHGESEGDFLNLTPSLAVQNIIDAYAYLVRLGFKRIALLGSSFGGYCALAASWKLPELAFLLLRCPAIYFTELPEIVDKCADWEKNGFVEWFSKKGAVKIGYGFYKDLQTQPLNLDAKMNQPTYIVHGDSDTVVPHHDSVHFCKTHPEVELFLVAGADHRFSAPVTFESMIRYTESVILKYVKSG